MGNYDDIINIKRHVSKKHSPMDISNRAKIFSPFAALKGYEDAIELASSKEEYIKLEHEKFFE